MPATITISGTTNSAATADPVAPPITSVSSIRSTPSATHGNPSSPDVSSRESSVTTPHAQS